MVFSSKQTSSWASLTYCSYEVTGLLLIVYIKVALFLRAPLLLNFQILYSKMSQFPWEELQGSLLLQVALPPGPKLCTTAAEMGAKIVAYFSPRDILTLQKGSWEEEVTSGVLSLSLSMEPPPYEQSGTRVIKSPVFPACHGWNSSHPTNGGGVDEESPITLSHFYLE